MTGAPDYFDLASLVVRFHCSSTDDDDGTGVVNVDTLADDVANRLEAVTLALRHVLAEVPMPDTSIERVVAAIAAAERVP